jgi:hypothetical protein
MLLSIDTSAGIIKTMGLAVIGSADALAELQPGFLLVLGDRFETFAAALAGLIARIPIAHCYGGDLTEGAFDDALRHSITKMSHLHFVAAEEYRWRVILIMLNPSFLNIPAWLIFSPFIPIFKSSFCYYPMSLMSFFLIILVLLWLSKHSLWCKHLYFLYRSLFCLLISLLLLLSSQLLS